MKQETMVLISNLSPIKVNHFTTPVGNFEIKIMIHRETGELFFMKTKNGELCELTNLKKLAELEERRCKKIS